MGAEATSLAAMKLRKALAVGYHVKCKSLHSKNKLLPRIGTDLPDSKMCRLIDLMQLYEQDLK